MEKVERHVANAIAHGARVLLGGKRHALGRYFFQPTILADVDATMEWLAKNFWSGGAAVSFP